MPIEIDDFERNKPFGIKKGIPHLVMHNDIKTEDDQVFDNTDFIGYAHDDEPPDSHMGPTVDTKLDEEDIWDFPRNAFN